MQHVARRILNRFSIATDSDAPGSALAVHDPGVGSESIFGAVLVPDHGRVIAMAIVYFAAASICRNTASPAGGAMK